MIPPITRVAQDLTAITTLYRQLPEQAINDSDNPAIPGGRAMIALAPVANLEAWENLNDATERYGKSYTFADVEDPDDAWPAFQLIAYWSQQWRRTRDAEYVTRLSLPNEVNFLRYSLEWAWETLDPKQWAEFEANIHSARTRLENIVGDGQRDIISDEVSCLLCGTALRRRMTPREGYEDDWWCQECRLHLTKAQFNLAASEAARRSLGLV